MSFNLGFGIGALLGGVVVDTAGLSSVGYYGAIIAAGAVAAVVMLTRMSRTAKV